MWLIQISNSLIKKLLQTFKKMFYFLLDWRGFMSVLFHKAENISFYSSKIWKFLMNAKKTHFTLLLLEKKSHLSSGEKGSHFAFNSHHTFVTSELTPNKWSCRRSSLCTSSSVAANFPGHSSNSLESEITGGSQRPEARALLLYVGEMARHWTEVHNSM